MLEPVDVRGSRLASRVRQELAAAWNVPPEAVDRLALALGLAYAENRKAHPLKRLSVFGAPDPDGVADEESEGVRLSLDRMDTEDGLFARLLEIRHDDPTNRIRNALNYGYRCLEALLKLDDRSADRMLERITEAMSADLPPAPPGDSKMAQGSAILVTIGADATSGAPVRWEFNRERGENTSANLRIAGQQGKGKTTALLGLLLDVARADACTGFILFDCKGDLSGETFAPFRAATKAKVISPVTRPIPINPFDAPRGSQNVNLLAQQFASVFNELVPIGPVQENLMRRGLMEAYSLASQEGRDGPSLGQVREAVRTVYGAENRKWADKVASTLDKLVEVPCFADRTEDFPIEELLCPSGKRAWIRPRNSPCLLSFRYDKEACRWERWPAPGRRRAR